MFTASAAINVTMPAMIQRLQNRFLKTGPPFSASLVESTSLNSCVPVPVPTPVSTSNSPRVDSICESRERWPTCKSQPAKGGLHCQFLGSAHGDSNVVKSEVGFGKRSTQKAPLIQMQNRFFESTNSNYIF